jgi:hypothetical protein
MRKKLLTLILTACMVLSMFSGLPLPTLAEGEAGDGYTRETTELGAAGNEVSGTYILGDDASGVYTSGDGTDVYSTDSDSSEISLLSFDDTLMAAANLGILRYSSIPETGWTEDITRAQATELAAGCYYNLRTPLGKYRRMRTITFDDVPAISTNATEGAINWCVDMDYISGYGRNFSSAGTVMKAEAAVLIYNILSRPTADYTDGIDFPDVENPQEQWFYQSVMTLNGLGIIPDGSFSPYTNITCAELLSWLTAMRGLYDETKWLNIRGYTAVTAGSASITRAQMAELVAGTLLRNELPAQDISGAPVFDDVSTDNMSENTYKAIRWCALYGYMFGENATAFNPTDIVTRAQAAVIIYRMTGRTDGAYTGGAVLSDVSKSSWYYDEVMNLYELNIITPASNGAFNPDSEISGADLLEWLTNLIYSSAEPTVFSCKELSDALSFPYIQSVIVTRDITVPEGGTLNINKDVSIYGNSSLYMNNCNVNVQNGATLTLGGFDGGGSVVDSGHLNVCAGGTLILNQNLNIAQQSSFTVEAGAKVIVGAGKTLYIGGSATIDGTIQLNSSGSEDVQYGELVAFNDMGGDGSITGNGRVRAQELYHYSGGEPVLDYSVLSVSVSDSVVKEPIKTVNVERTDDFNSALAADFLNINVSGNEVVMSSWSMAGVESFKHIFVQPGSRLTFSDAANKVTVPSYVFITLQYYLDETDEAFATMSIAEGTEVEVKSDWSLIGRSDISGIEFQNEKNWSGAFGGVVAGYKDDTANGIPDPTYRECYFSRLGDPGEAIENCALSMSSVDALVYSGGISATLAPQSGGTGLTAGALFVSEGSSLTIESGFALNVTKRESSGWKSAEQDNKYGRDFYYIHSADPGYVNVDNMSSLTVNGELRCEATLDWTEIIVISSDEADDFNGKDNVVSIGTNAYYAGLMGVPEDSLLAVFSNGNNPELWTGAIDINGGKMSVGASGVVHAHHIWLGINSWNATQHGLGFEEAAGSDVLFDGFFARSIIEDVTVDGLIIDGDVNIEPGVKLTVTNSLEVTHNLRVYGELALADGATATVAQGYGIHQMYYNKQGEYAFGTLTGYTGPYYVGVEDEGALDSLLKNPQVPHENIALLFDWYLGDWSIFNNADAYPDKTVTINANVLTQNTLQVYDSFKLIISGELSNVNYIKADNAVIKAYSLLNNAVIEAMNNGRFISGDTENNGYLNAYEGGQVWLTGYVSGYGSFYRNVYHNGLAARYLNYDNNGAPYEDLNNDLQNYLTMPKARRILIFYHMTYDGTPTTENPFGSWNMTPVQAQYLTLTNSGGTPVTDALCTLTEQDKAYDDFTAFTPPDWGSFTAYTVGTDTYSIKIDVALPQTGFYTQPYRYFPNGSVEEGEDVSNYYIFNADTKKYIPASGTAVSGTVYYTQSWGPSEEFWTEKLSFVPGEDTVFYFIYNGMYSSNASVTQLIQREGGDKVDCVPCYSNNGLNIWKVTVRNGVTESFNLQLGVGLTDGGGNYWEQTNWLWLNVGDYEHLVWLHEDRIRDGKFDENDTRAEVVKGDMWGGAFFLYTRDGDSWIYKPVSEANLQVNGVPLDSSQGITFEKYTSQTNIEYLKLDFKSTGPYHVTYHEGTSVCEFGVAFNVIDLPNFGVYSAREAVEANYINNWEMQFTTYRTVYVLPAGGLSLAAMDLTESEIGGGYENISLGQEVIGGDKTVTLGDYVRITAEYGGDSICDDFKIEFLSSPLLTGNIYFWFNLKDADGNQIMNRDFNFSSGVERADTLAYNDSALTPTGNIIEGLTARSAVYCNFTAETDGWYSFKLTEASKNGDFGLFVFDNDWILKAQDWKNFDTNNNRLLHAEYLKAGTYKVAVYDRTGNTSDGSIKLSAAATFQPAAPTAENAQLCLDSTGVYSIRLSEGGNGNTRFRIYAYIDGKWQQKGDRGLWHDDNLNRWNDSDFSFLDMLNDGETAAQFGVTTYNDDGVESPMLILALPQGYTVTRDDSAFETLTYDVQLRQFINGDILISAKDGGRQAVFSPSGIYRLYHERQNGTWIERNCDIGFGTDRARVQTSSHYDGNLTDYYGGWWTLEVGRQKFDSNKYIVGLGTAAREYDDGSVGSHGSLDIRTEDLWIVRSEEDLSEVTDVRYNLDMNFWYTPNSARFWLGELSWSETEGYKCRYTEIKPTETSSAPLKLMQGTTALNLAYNDKTQRWEFDLSAQDAGDILRLVFTDSGEIELTSEFITAVTPNSAFFNSPAPSKENFSSWRIWSNQDNVYFVWDEDFEKGTGFTSISVLVMCGTEYVSGDGRAYYKQDDNGNFYVLENGVNGEWCYVVDSKPIDIDITHYGENYLKFTNTGNIGDLHLRLIFRNGDNVLFERSLRIDWAAYMQPAGIGGINISVPQELDYITTVGIAQTENASEMYDWGYLDNGSVFFGEYTALAPGRYYLYYKQGENWVLLKGISALCPGIDEIEYDGGALAVSFALDESYKGNKLFAASYEDGQMIGVKAVELDEEDISAGRVQFALTEGDTYKVFILDGSYKLKMFDMIGSTVMH